MALSTPRLTGELIGAEAAAARLGVSKATLYAYVSRGLLAAVPDPTDPRRRRYSAFEVERLRDGHRASARAAQAAPGTLYEGHALVDTALTGVVDGDIVMRGRRLVPWSREATLEETAALLWDVRVEPAFAAAVPVMPDLWHRTAAELERADPVLRAVTLWGLAMPVLTGGVHLQGDALAAALGQHLRVAFACWLGRPPGTDPLHQQVARAWDLPPDRHEALRQALVLCADVMPNLMGLSSRMLASVQGSLGACLLASLGYGFVRLSGGEFEAVEALFDEVAAVGSLDTVAASYRARGEDLPGFHHPLFVRGDPRATALLALAAPLGSQVADWPRTGPDGTPMHPTLDVGLVALRRALQAPRHAALTLTHMARCVGVLAQSVEQRTVGRRMWVQGRYVGPSPDPRAGG
jgi:citrate synthase